MNDTQHKRSVYSSKPLLIVVIYAVSGALWILTSDWLVESLVQNAEQFAIVSMFKGWFYVAATSLLLYGLLALHYSKLQDERVRADRSALLQAEVLANLTEGVSVVGTDGRVLYVNPAFAAMFGYQPDELIGRDVAILNAQTSEYSPEAIAEQIMAQLRTTGCWQDDLLNRRKDGSVFWCHASVSSFVMPIWGEVWLTVQYDISERKLAESKLNQRTEMLERFNRIAVDRELAMAAMKQQLNALAGELGRDPTYPPSVYASNVPDNDWQPEHASQAQLAMINLLEDAQAARDQAKAIAASLSESEQRLMMAQEGAHVGIWEWKLGDGSLYWSPEYERLYGVSPGSPHSNEDWRSRVHPDDLQLIDTEWEQHIEHGEPFEVEFRIRREDNGETRWMYCVGSSRCDENGKVAILSGINIDITERKQAELRLAESEQRYRTVADNLPGAIYRCEVHPPWRMIMISDGVKQLTGYDAAAFLGADAALTWGELILADDLAALQPNFDIAIAARQSYRLVYRIRHADGGIRWMLEHGRAIYDAAGQPEYLDGVITDKTAQKQTEGQLRARNLELERFNKVAMGRELDMIEMKKLINALSLELGREPPHPLAFLNEDERQGKML